MGPIIVLRAKWVVKNITFTKFYTLKIAKQEQLIEYIFFLIYIL